MSFGVTEAGFVLKTQTDIKASIDANVRSDLSATANTGSSSVIGQYNAIISAEIAECWEALEDVYSSDDPDQATGVSLDDVSSISGTIREDSQPSVVEETIVGDAGTVFDSGKVVSVPGITGTRFATIAPVTLAAAPAYANSHSYDARAKVTRGGRVYAAVSPGLSAASGGPSGTGTAIVDNTVTWRYLGEGTAYADVEAWSEELAAVEANAFTLTLLETPTAGVSAVVNLQDAELGRTDEPDAELRLRREEELHADAYAALEAIRGHVARVEGVVTVRVFENTSAATVDGLPPHSIEVLVLKRAGAPVDVDDQIRQAIFESKGGGVYTHGTEVGTVEDDAGDVHTIRFSLTEELEIYAAFTMEVTSDYPGNGDDLVKEAMVEYADAAWVNGYDAVAFQLAAQSAQIEGVFNVTAAAVGLAPSPVALKQTVTSRQVARLDTSRIALTKSVVLP